MWQDLNEACGEKNLKAIPQGKSHVKFVEAGKKLYFATHVGYYSIIDDMEKLGVPPTASAKAWALTTNSENSISLSGPMRLAS